MFKSTNSGIEIFKSMFFLGVCASFMYPFLEYNEGNLLMKMPYDTVPLFLCFIFTVLFDLLQRENENQIINKIEIFINAIVFSAGIIFYGIKYENAFSIIALSFSSFIFCLKCLHLFNHLFLLDIRRKK